jgi:hypothetical protein
MRIEWGYLPWIIGALCAATTAAAIAIAVTHRAESSNAMAPLELHAGGASIPLALSTPPTPAEPVAAPDAAAAAPAMPDPGLADMQPADAGAADAATTTVWECVQNGEHTFSDTPCGAVAIAHLIAEPNRMSSPAPDPGPYGRAPPGQWAPGAYGPGAYADPAQSYDAQNAPDDGTGGGYDGGYVVGESHGLDRYERRVHPVRQRESERHSPGATVPRYR